MQQDSDNLHLMVGRLESKVDGIAETLKTMAVQDKAVSHRVRKLENAKLYFIAFIAGASMKMFGIDIIHAIGMLIG